MRENYSKNIIHEFNEFLMLSFQIIAKFLVFCKYFKLIFAFYMLLRIGKGVCVQSDSNSLLIFILL